MAADVVTFRDGYGTQTTIYLDTDHNRRLAIQGDKIWRTLTIYQKMSAIPAIIAFVSIIFLLSCAGSGCFSSDQDETTRGMCDHSCSLPTKILVGILSIVGIVGLCCICPRACKKE